MGKHPVDKAIPESGDARKTCFVMMPISDVDGYPANHFGEVYAQLIQPAVIAAGYECELATSTNSSHMIQLDIVTKVVTADLCICDMSTKNANVAFEYGIRQAFDKPTVLIKDDKTDRIFDLSGLRDITYDHTLRIAATLATREKITNAIRDTVSGAEDNKQIFSLVKLMKLTEAASLPTGEVNADEARFALIDQKLDRIARSVSHIPPRPPRPPEYDIEQDNPLAPGLGVFVGQLPYSISNNVMTITRSDGSILEKIPIDQFDYNVYVAKFGTKIANNIKEIISQTLKN